MRSKGENQRWRWNQKYEHNRKVKVKSVVFLCGILSSPERKQEAAGAINSET